jgi:hypothetical protein
MNKARDVQSNITAVDQAGNIVRDAGAAVSNLPQTQAAQVMQDQRRQRQQRQPQDAVVRPISPVPNALPQQQQQPVSRPVPLNADDTAAADAAHLGSGGSGTPGGGSRTPRGGFSYSPQAGWRRQYPELPPDQQPQY